MLKWVILALAAVIIPAAQAGLGAAGGRANTINSSSAESDVFLLNSSGATFVVPQNAFNISTITLEAREPIVFTVKRNVHLLSE